MQTLETLRALIKNLGIGMKNQYLVTGGAGFIGANFIHYVLQNGAAIAVLNLDKLTYAGNLDSLTSLEGNPNYQFVKGDIGNTAVVSTILAEFKPTVIVNFAAESHVDRSIDGPGEFIQTNVNGTFHLLQSALSYWDTLPSEAKRSFRFLHVSTDEVYGSLGETGLFNENTPYSPNSPYSASKAASDHLVRAWHHTYGLPVLTTNCSNNYGPYQFPEKLIPMVLLNALNGKAIPIYGDGRNIRDWLYVEDHCRGIETVIKQGMVGETYNIGGHNEMTNLEVVHTICAKLDDIQPKLNGTYIDQITFVKDRPGHDRRYAIDATKIKRELDWLPKESFETGIRKTVEWYIDNMNWVNHILAGEYQMGRLGLKDG